MTLEDILVPSPPPIAQGSDGTLRVRGSRVTVDVIISAYKNGASAEEIAKAYDSVALSDVHVVISFYLKNRQRVKAYLELRAKAAFETQSEFPPKDSWLVIRQRLLERRNRTAVGSYHA